MKKIIPSLAIAVSLSISACNGVYKFDKKIPLTGNNGYDYLSIDTINNRLYVTHTATINVVDLKTEKEIGVIEGLKVAHGIAIVNKYNKGFISDDMANTVVVFDLKTLKTLATITLNADGPDAIVYDPFSDKVFCFNADSNNASVIDPNTLKQVGTVALTGSPEFAVSDGKGKMYSNIGDKNSLDVIDTKAMKVIKNYPIPICKGPTGLAIDIKNNRVFSVCRENEGMSVIDVTNGKLITTVSIGAGVDAVTYDEATHLIFSSNGDATTTIIKQKSADEYSVVQKLKTQGHAKTMALDSRTHKIYLSVADQEKGTRNMVLNSFKVLIYKMR